MKFLIMICPFDMYKITEYSYKQADKLNVIIRPSNQKYKKIDVFNKKGEYLCSIGDNRYKDFPTYILEKGIKYANERRKLYNLRHAKTSIIKNSPSYFAKKILW